MDCKIIKYKLKKKKLENKINKILVSNKKLYLANIVNSINKIKFIPDVVEKLIEKNQDNIIYIIVTGIYASGKSTLISELENFFGESNILSKINITKIEEFEIIKNFKKINKLGIILIECVLDIANQVIQFLSGSNLYIINIMTSSNNSLLQYKNKLINKIFFDFGLKTNYFNHNINKIIKQIQLTENLEQINIYKQIDLTKPNVSDNDFNFLDKYIIIINQHYSKEKINLLLGLDTNLVHNQNIDYFYF